MKKISMVALSLSAFAALAAPKSDAVAGAKSASAKPLGFAKLNEISKSRDRNYVFINAHRAIAIPSERIPENSLAAIKRAIAEGADIIEVDPKTTRDKRIILSHEGKDLNRIMQFVGGVDGNATVQDIPYESSDPSKPCFKTAKLRVSREDPTPTDERPCTWEELLDACKGKCFIHADASYWNMMPDYHLIWDPIVERGMQEQVLFNVDKESNQYIMSPGKPTPSGLRGFFWEWVSWPAGKPAPVEHLKKLVAAQENEGGMRICMMPIGMYGHNLAGDFGDRASLDVDPRVGWDKLLDLGANVLMTDYPAELRKFLEQRGRRTAKPNDNRHRVIPEIIENAEYDGSVAPGLQSKKLKLPDSKSCWTDGTTGEKTVWWNVTPPKSSFKGDDFLGYLAAHPLRVESSPLASGGDLVFKYVQSGKDHYIHVFTNVNAAASFAPKKPVKARVLLVGGGGGAGKSSKLHGPWSFQTAGGGNGGAVVEKDDVVVSGSCAVTVGKGGEPRAAGSASSIALGAKKLSAAGGAAGADGKEGELGASGDGAAEKGKSGFHARGHFNGGGNGAMSTIFVEPLCFGGGGAAAAHSDNCAGDYKIRGGKGGGGSSSSASYDNKLHFAKPGVDGLGGGGAGGPMRGTDAELLGKRGGNGIVVISY